MSALAEHSTDHDDQPGPQRKDLTWDEYLALPYETRNASLIDGEVVVNPPNAQHEWILSNFHLIFRLWAREAPGRGEISTQQPVKITDRRGYQPDFAWYPQESCAPPGEKKRHTGLPSLVVEVLSPSTRASDLVRKRRDYEQIGIGEVWFVEQDPDRFCIIVCQRVDGGSFVDTHLKPGDRLTSPLLEGFSIDVAELFQD